MKILLRSLSLRIALATLVVMLFACAQLNPIAAADTREQKALAVYGSLVIGAEQIAALLKPDTLPDNVQSRLVVLGDRVTTAAELGLKTYQQAEAARAKFVVDASQSDQLSAALASLDSWVTQAGPLVDELRTAVRGAR